MSTSLTPIPQPQPNAMTLQDKLSYCSKLAQADLLPPEYYNKPGNVLLAVEYGDALGIPPIMAIQQVHIINKKPTASAGLISALVRRSGHRLRVTGNNKEATAQIVRCDDKEYTYSVTFTMEDAEKAGLLSNPTWKKYPTAMLKSRAITAVARDACQESLNGVCYTPEELAPHKEYTVDGEPVLVTVLEIAPAEKTLALPAEVAEIQENKTKPQGRIPGPVQGADPNAERQALLIRLLRLRQEADEVLDADGDTDWTDTEAQTLLRFQKWTGADFAKVPVQVSDDGTLVAVDFAAFNVAWLKKSLERYEAHKAETERAESEAWEAANAVGGGE